MRNDRLCQGMHISYRGRKYRIEARIDNETLRLRDIALDEPVALSEKQLLEGLAKGELELLGDDPQKSQAILVNSPSDLTMLSDKDRQEVIRRQAYVHEVIEAKRGSLSTEDFKQFIEDVSKRINDPAPPSPITLYRWVRRFKEAEEDVRALVPSTKQRGSTGSRMPVEIQHIIEQTVNEGYLRPERPTIQQVVDMIHARVYRENEFRDAGNKLVCPSRASIYRYVQGLDQYEVTKARFGRHIAEIKYRAVKEGARPIRPLERVEMDHTKLDLFVIDPDTCMPIGRPWLTSIIDVCTKMIIGVHIGFDPPSYISVMHCLRHAVMPKLEMRQRYPDIQHEWNTYGLPETLVVDNGKEFHSNAFEDACRQLGISIQYAPPRLAWYKGSIERYFGTQNRKLLSGVPGRTFSNIFEKADYDPERNAVVSFKALMEMVHFWIVDIYHQDAHRGLGDVPQRVWDTLIREYPPALPRHVNSLNVLLGHVTERTVNPQGIDLHGLIYNSEELALLRRTKMPGKRLKVKIKYDPNDISLIYAYDQINDKYIAVPALNQEYTRGLTLWQHRVIRNYARKQVKDYVNMSDLLKAKMKLQAMVAHEWNLFNRSTSRQKIARFRDYGEEPVLPPPDIPLLITPTVIELTPSIQPGQRTYGGIADFSSQEHVEAIDQDVPHKVSESAIVAIETSVEAPSSGQPLESEKSKTTPLRKTRKSQATSEAQPPIDHHHQQGELETPDWSDLDLSGFEGGYNLPE